MKRWTMIAALALTAAALPCVADTLPANYLDLIRHENYAAAEALADAQIARAEVNAKSKPELLCAALEQRLAAARHALAAADTAKPPNPAEQVVAVERLFDLLDEAAQLETSEAQTLVDRDLELNRSASPGGSAAYARALERKARVQYVTYHLAAAAATAQQALDMLGKNGGDADADATMRSLLGHVLTAQHVRTDEAESLLEAAIASLDARHVVDLRLAIALRDLSFDYMLQGKLDRSQSVIDRAKLVAATLAGPDSALNAEAITAEAYILRERGDIAAAVGLLEHALQILRDAKPRQQDAYARALLSLAQTLRISGAIDAAAQRYRDCISLEQAHPSFGGLFLAGAHNGLGLILNTGERPAEAIPHLEPALALYRSLFGADSEGVLTTENNLALAYRNVGRLDESTALLRHVVEADERKPPRADRYPIQLVNLGDTYVWQGRYADAEPLYRRFLTRIGPGHDVDEIEPRSALSGLAASLWGQGRDGEAFETALAAEHSRQKRVRIAGADLGETHAVGMLENTVGGLHWAVAIAAKTQRAEQARAAWNLAMDSTGMVTTISARRLAVARASNDPQLASVWKEWKRRDEALVQARVEAAREPSAKTSAALDAAEQTFDVAERALAHAAGANGAALGNARAGLPQVLAALPTDSVLVSYFSGSYVRPQDVQRYDKDLPGHLFAFVASHDAVPRLIDLGPQPAISEAVRRWLDQIVDRNSAAKSRDDAGRQVRELVWDPIAKHWPQHRVLVVPSESLERVPFAALPAADGRYLVEAGYAFHLLDHERDVLASPAPTGAPTLSLIGAPDFAVDTRIADTGVRGVCAGLRGATFSPLPQAAREIEELRDLWSQRKDAIAPTVLVGTDASEARARAALHGSRIVHFATHGIFLGDQCKVPAADTRSIKTVDTVKPPEEVQDLSALVLSGANRPATSTEDDGLLTSEEIAALDLTGTEWAVLSACDSGIGKNVRGEGVFGLRRAFRLAGAHSVVMSLWPVSDASTADWMLALYRARLQQHATTIDAVRTADLALIKQRRDAGLDPSPFYWAAFVAAGDWR